MAPRDVFWAGHFQSLMEHFQVWHLLCSLLKYCASSQVGRHFEQTETQPHGRKGGRSFFTWNLRGDRELFAEDPVLLNDRETKMGQENASTC